MATVPLPPHPRPRRARLLAVGLAAVATVVSVAVLPGNARAAVTSNQTGYHNGYFYVFSREGGQASMTLGPGGNYSATWTNVNYMLAGKGWNPGARMNVSYSGTFNPAGNAFLALTGWTTSPLVQYYVVESWGAYRPVGTFKGTVTTNGATYSVYETTRINWLSIQGIATYKQYWSVRQGQRLGALGGTISTGNHFDAWRSFGMNLGTFNYMVMATEAFQSSGNANITVGGTA